MKFIKKLILIVVLIVIIILGVIIYSGYDMYKTALNTMPLNEKILEIKDDLNYTTIDDLPQMYKNAVIAVEDHRFYSHGAIDVIAIARAIYVDVKTLSFVEGGSTITQQLAKNVYFTQERTAKRKVAEILMAFKIEEQYSKDEILELYVNTSYFGDGYYNVKEASNGYFKKEPIKMNNYEATLLAGIPNAPSVYAPTKNIKLAEQRQKQVLHSLVKYKYITQEEMNNIVANKY